MIRTFELRDLKAHRDTRLELGRFTMLVGDNASGKTSVLEALALQASLGHDPASVLRGAWSPADLLRRDSRTPTRLSSTGSRNRADWRTQLTLNIRSKELGNANPAWYVEFTGQLPSGEPVTLVADAQGVKQNWERYWDHVRAILGTTGIYRLRSERIAAPAYSDRPGAAIESDGTNTAVALAAMKLGDDEAFERVEAAMRTLIPSVERVRIRPATVRRSAPELGDVVGSKLYFDFRGAPGIPADGASQGTLIVLALLAILHGANRPNLILLDDLDHALHPRAQMELVRMLQHLLTLEEFSDVQVVATTHSPYTLDELDPRDVYAFALRDDGTVACKRLSEHPEAERTRGTLKAGQLWSLDPERDWVLRG